MQRLSNRKKRSSSLASRLLKALLASILFLILFVAVALIGLYSYLEPQLPDIVSLKDVRYQVPMNVYSRDGKLMAQYGEAKRFPVAFADVPKDMVHAFLAAEDDRFFDHPGVDYQGLLRAVYAFASTGEKRQGGSTITMQVARNFFLSSEKTLSRKIKEILLAVKIESTLPKEQILELYLNKIYFGHHAYGIVAAGQIYYGKPIAELSLGETAMIAGLPKAPSRYNPIVDAPRAIERRNYVLQRMAKLQFITNDQYKAAVAEGNTARLHTQAIELSAPYVAEMARNEMVHRYGDDAYVNGYQVYTTIDSRLQLEAEASLRKALRRYDMQRGYRGNKQRIDLKKAKTDADWEKALRSIPNGGDSVPGVVISLKDRTATVYVAGTGLTEVDLDQSAWVRNPRESLKSGAIVRLSAKDNGAWVLTQIPEVEGAIVALDPKDGAIVALVGGYDFALSSFNRAVQSQRQPGSGFKPIVYATAMENGYTPASVVVDGPIAVRDESQDGGVWRPKNSGGKFMGPVRLRVALAKSRNLVSVRLMKDLGMDKVLEMAERFGFTSEELPRGLSLALGSGHASPLRMAEAYAPFANGGFHVPPYLITRIDTREGETLYDAKPPRACPDCPPDAQPVEPIAPRILSPQVHYMMNSMLQDVVRTGTAKKALQLNRKDIAGKTGTTNRSRDVWFNGYSPSLVTVCWMGYDSFKSLGKQTGGDLALPMWIDFMKTALAEVPEETFQQPEGLTATRIDPKSGMLAGKGGNDGVMEFFPADKVPQKRAKPAAKRKTPKAEEGGSDSFGDYSGGSRARGSSGGRSMESLF